MITTVLLCSFFLMCLITTGILFLAKKKSIKYKEEIRIGSIGTLWFGYISWACIYMAQYRPNYVK